LSLLLKFTLIPFLFHKKKIPQVDMTQTHNRLDEVKELLGKTLEAHGDKETFVNAFIEQQLALVLGQLDAYRPEHEKLVADVAATKEAAEGVLSRVDGKNLEGLSREEVALVVAAGLEGVQEVTRGIKERVDDVDRHVRSEEAEGLVGHVRDAAARVAEQLAPLRGAVDAVQANLQTLAA
jgi:hypothetical protein